MPITDRRRRWGVRFIGVLVIAVLLYIFRVQLLQGAGHLLMNEDAPASTEVLVVLGGNSLERATEALNWYREDRAKLLVCTGGNVPSALEAVGQPLFEAELTRKYLLEQGVDSSRVIALTGSTSTLEESQEVRAWAERRQLAEVTVLSSRFHTGRVKRVFNKTFDGSMTKVYTAGAPALNYREDEWWKSEEGLIMVNNEYIKSLYYFLKH